MEVECTLGMCWAGWVEAQRFINPGHKPLDLQRKTTHHILQLAMVLLTVSCRHDLCCHSRRHCTAN